MLNLILKMDLNSGIRKCLESQQLLSALEVIDSDKIITMGPTQQLK